MAKKEKAAAAAAKPVTGKKLLDAARKHQDALQAQGLSSTVLDRYAISLKGLESKGPNPAAQTLIKDLQREAGEVQAAIRKEFPGNASFHSVFQAGEPVPSEPRAVLALGRLVLKEAPDYSQNLIKHAINAATLNHIRSLCTQLEKELGGSDPAVDAKQLEEQILAGARRAFEGKPELAQFEA
jgi:hypothetical protein